MNAVAVVQAAVATALVVAMPVRDRPETRRLKRSAGTGAKVASYQRVMGVLRGLTAILLVTGPASGWLRAPEAAARRTARVGSRPVRGVVIGLAIGLALPVVIGLLRPEARRRMAKPPEAHVLLDLRGLALWPRGGLRALRSS